VSDYESVEYNPEGRFATMCKVCGLIVHDEDIHTGWHEKLKEEIRLANVGFGGLF
jgi:hypothetical protein